MGMLIKGKWEVNEEPINDKKGAFKRVESSFRHWISDSDDRFTPEANRYHIYISYACPWAHRALIMRKLKGLEHCISLSSVDVVLGKNGWSFAKDDTDTKDPLFDSEFLHQIYTRADTNYTGRVTVPVLWDKHEQTIVNNESSEILRQLNRSFQKYSETDYDYYPESKRKAIDEVNDFIYTTINNGVYKCGFAKSQQAYDEAYMALFSALDKVDELLANKRYLIGDQITEADIRLFTTLIRFDSVYVGHFKCNKKRIDDYPNLGNYLCDIYQTDGISETVDFDKIKRHYYISHTQINPTQIVPGGPDVNYMRKHNRG